MEEIQKDNQDIIDFANDLRWQMREGFNDKITESIFSDAIKITDENVKYNDGRSTFTFDRQLDRIVTNKYLGFPIMLLILTAVFWLTIVGANYPSSMLATFFIDFLHPILKSGAEALHFPWWLSGVLVDGIYLAVAWVISVMLPPMAIFFPVYTLLEDYGYLPRVAFNLDNIFRKAGTNGKQALTLSMGFGCNVAGVVASRVIESPRERLIAIVTNNFSICNGRWPTMIILASIFIAPLVATPALASLVTASVVVSVALLGVVLSFVVSYALSKTILKGEASSFSLELPPYRPPNFWMTLYTSIIDRTLIVLWRAIVFAAPAGFLIWTLSNITINDISLAVHFINFSDPLAWFIGLNGVILLAYIVAIPANEIVVPTILMLTVLSANVAGFGDGAGVMFELDSMKDTGDILRAGGWTVLTAINVMLFSLLHNPCSTTIYTIYKETNSMKWTLISTFLPLAMGFATCFFVTQVYRLWWG